MPSIEQPFPGQSDVGEAQDFLRTITARHGKLAFFANDSGAVAQSLELYGEWAENEINFLRQFIEPGFTVLDVGAYVGTHTLAFSRFVGVEGRVIAFEAQPDTFALLRHNVSINQLKNVRLENMAVCNSTGHAEISLINPGESESFGSMSLRADLDGRQTGSRHSETRHAEVALGSIDSLELEACHLIKIDAEGMESTIIAGAASTIQRLSPVVYAECNSIADGLRSIEQLKALDYEARLHVVRAFAPDNFLEARENIFDDACEAALVAVHSSKADYLDAIVPRSCELLVKIVAADDLALGLLNKPQYVEEVLVPSAAAASGGDRWVHDIRETTFAKEKAENDATWARNALMEERVRLDQESQTLIAAVKALHTRIDAEVAGLKGELVDARAAAEAIRRELAAARETITEEKARLSGEIDDVREKLIKVSSELYKHNVEMANQTALFEAAMRQAGFARDLANTAARNGAAAEFARNEAQALCAEIAHKAEVLTESLSQADARLSAVYASRSWRLTRPLRAILSRLRSRQ